MEKKLPNVFVNHVEKQFHNNEHVFYSKEQEEMKKQEDRSVGLEPNINQKINAVFGSPKYIYKADVVIKTNKEVVTKRIVGRNATHLITIENELIPISDIIDIEFVNEQKK